MDGRISFTHYSPGRLRLKAARLKADRAMGERIRAALQAVAGIDRVSVNALTGSLLVEFSPRSLAAPEASRALLHALAGVFPEAFEGESIRFSVQGLEGRERLVDRVRASLAEVEAIREVALDSGELSVKYDPESISIPAVLNALAG